MSSGRVIEWLNILIISYRILMDDFDERFNRKASNASRDSRAFSTWELLECIDTLIVFIEEIRRKRCRRRKRQVLHQCHRQISSNTFSSFFSVVVVRRWRSTWSTILFYALIRSLADYVVRWTSISCGRIIINMTLKTEYTSSIPA